MYETSQKEIKFEQYYSSIVEKFTDSLQVYLATIFNRYDIHTDEIGENLIKTENFYAKEIIFVLVIKEADTAWLAGPKAILENRLLSLRKIWGIKILVLNYDLNTLEEESIVKFCESNEWFNEYDKMIHQKSGSMEEVKACVSGWFSYVNRDMEDTDFSTDILSYIASDEEELRQLKENASNVETAGLADLIQRDDILEKRIITYFDRLTTKDIGDIGENLVHGHECMRIKLGGREDLLHLIKRIPTQFAVGYDISSVELDERKRYIEVKTTISSKPLHFNRMHLTKNEWNTASSTHDRYYVYRLMLSKNKRKLFLLQDPVGLYKKDKINMIPSDGADITFDPKEVGYFEELLTWKN